VEVPERKYIGRIFSDETVDENDEYKYDKVVDVVGNESYDYYYFQYYNYKKHTVQPKRNDMEQTAFKEFPPLKKRGSDFFWDPQN
jgi:hypothetical protein